MIEAARDYPKIQFVHASGVKAHKLNIPNYHNAFAAIYEGRYLAGIVAGMKLNEMIDNGEITADRAKMGYIGAYTYAEVISGYTAFFLGARSICPSATMEITFTGSWDDETAEREAANKLIKSGCVLLSQHSDTVGAPMACENAGVPDISYNGSTKAVAPNTYLVSSKINWTPFLEYAISSVINGEEFDTDWTGTLNDGAIILTEYGDNVAEGTAEAVDDASAKLESGEIHVFDTSAFTVNGKKITSYMADVDSDPNRVGDHEAIVDGYFNESGEGLRSAPFFDLMIDGISLLDTAF